MNCRTRLLAMALFAAANACLLPAGAAASDTQLTLSEVETVVARHFALQEGYRSGDLLYRSQVKPIAAELAKLGGYQDELNTILEKVPPDEAFLVRQLHSPPGRSFMRQVAKYPLGYDRLDHLSAIPRGKEIVTQLIRDKGGYKMIEYMTIGGQGGLNLGRELSRVHGGTDFNQPTGRIYTEQQLLEALRPLYEK